MTIQRRSNGCRRLKRHRCHDTCPWDAPSGSGKARSQSSVDDTTHRGRRASNSRILNSAGRHDTSSPPTSRGGTPSVLIRSAACAADTAPLYAAGGALSGAPSEGRQRPDPARARATTRTERNGQHVAWFATAGPESARQPSARGHSGAQTETTLRAPEPPAPRAADSLRACVEGRQRPGPAPGTTWSASRPFPRAPPPQTASPPDDDDTATARQGGRPPCRSSSSSGLCVSATGALSAPGYVGSGPGVSATYTSAPGYVGSGPRGSGPGSGPAVLALGPGPAPGPAAPRCSCRLRPFTSYVLGRQSGGTGSASSGGTAEVVHRGGRVLHKGFPQGRSAGGGRAYDGGAQRQRRCPPRATQCPGQVGP